MIFCINMGPYDILYTVIYCLFLQICRKKLYPSKYWYMRAIILFAYEVKYL